MPLYSRNTKQWVTVEATDAPIFRTTTYNGERFVGGELAQEYQIVISNGDPRSRTLAVVTVDGRNVIDASVGSASGPGYVLGPNENQAIKGWRTSNDEIAAFVLTRGGDSYSTRAFADSGNIGVIGVAFFSEEKIERYGVFGVMRSRSSILARRRVRRVVRAQASDRASKVTSLRPLSNGPAPPRCTSFATT